MSSPELKSDISYTRGLAALALFVVMAAVVIGANFGAGQGYPGDANLTASIGYAMFNVGIEGISGQTLVDSEGFLVAFEIIDLVLVAALAGAVLLARRERSESVTAMLADGGRELKRTIRGDSSNDDTADRAHDGGDQ